MIYVFGDVDVEVDAGSLVKHQWSLLRGIYLLGPDSLHL